MNEAVKTVSVILRSKWFWYAVIGIVLYFVIRRNLYRLKAETAPRSVDYPRDENGAIVTVNEERKSQLRELAKQVNVDITGVNWTTTVPESVEKLGRISDPEMLYTAKYYKQYITRGTSLYDDIDSEAYVWSGVDDKIMAQLKKIGEY